MKDSADTTTTDLFPEAKKGRGRPSTGKAKTAAERQATYRENKLKKAKGNPYGQKNLNIWVEAGCKWNLEYLARHYEISPAKMIERLVQEAHEKKMKTMEYGSEEYNHYFRDM